MSWDMAIATIMHSGSGYSPAWSPCNRLITIASFNTGVQILDGMTLKQLKLFTYPDGRPHCATFSPDSRMLVCVGHGQAPIVCWDIQTGVPVCKIPTEEIYGDPYSITYSKCGTMLGVLFLDTGTGDAYYAGGVCVIGTYNVLSGTSICYHQIDGLVNTIWTNGGCVQFATLDVESITIWEVEFTSKDPPTEVRSTPAPDNFDPFEQFIFLPNPSRLAFKHRKSLLVWDICYSKLFLEYVYDDEVIGMAFSSDGNLFVSTTQAGEAFVWKESPTAGYILYQRVRAGIYLQLVFSPSGQSITVHNYSTLQLLRTKDLTASPLGVLPQPLVCDRCFILRFSQDRPLAVAARLGDNIVTVIDLMSGVQWLDIDAGMPVYGLGVAKSTLIVVGNQKIITWNIPPGAHVLGTRLNIDDSSQTTSFCCPGFGGSLYKTALISSDLSYVIINFSGGLRIYNLSTGKLLGGHRVYTFFIHLTSDGHEVWGSTSSGNQGWAITKDRSSNVMRLKSLGTHGPPSIALPWQSSQGHQVTDNGWIFSSSGKRVLWLPYHLRSQNRMWGGQFLTLLHSELAGVVILELLEE